MRSGGRAAAEDEMWKNMLRNDDTPKKASDKVRRFAELHILVAKFYPSEITSCLRAVLLIIVT